MHRATWLFYRNNQTSPSAEPRQRLWQLPRSSGISMPRIARPAHAKICEGFSVCDFWWIFFVLSQPDVAGRATAYSPNRKNARKIGECPRYSSTVYSTVLLYGTHSPLRLSRCELEATASIHPRRSSETQISCSWWVCRRSTDQSLACSHWPSSVATAASSTCPQDPILQEAPRDQQDRPYSSRGHAIQCSIAVGYGKRQLSNQNVCRSIARPGQNNQTRSRGCQRAADIAKCTILSIVYLANHACATGSPYCLWFCVDGASLPTTCGRDCWCCS